MGAASLFVHNMSIFSGYRKIILGVIRKTQPGVRDNAFVYIINCQEYLNWEPIFFWDHYF